MKQKVKRFISGIVALSVFLTTFTTSALAANYSSESNGGNSTKFYLCTIDELPYVDVVRLANGKVLKVTSGLKIDAESILTSSNGSACAENFDGLYGMFSQPETITSIQRWYEEGTTEENIDSAEKAVTSETSLAMMMTNLSGTTANVTATEKIVVTGRSARIGTSNINETVTLKVLGGMSVSDDGYLLIRNAPWTTSTGSKMNQKLVVALSQPIEVDSGGHLYLDVGDSIAGTGPATDQGRPPVQDELIAPSGQSAIVVKNGGEVHIGAFLIGRAENDTTEIPLIAVETGGKLVMEQSSSTNPQYDEHGMPVYDYSADELPHAAKWNTTITNGSSSTEPAITVAKDATLTLNGGTVTSESAGVPAVKVEAGGIVEIPTGTNAAVTAVGEGDTVAQAIDLEAGAVVHKGVDSGMTTLEVTVSQSGENYVDNYGNIILAAGANTTMNAAVILADGTLIEGTKEEAPVVSYTEEGGATFTTVAVPAGGTVTSVDGKTVTWGKGGTVTGGADQETTLTQKIGIDLDKTELELHQDAAAKLEATVVPDGTEGTRTWSTSDDKVATVDENGNVKAVGAGEATITLTLTQTPADEAADDTLAVATCKVTVTGHQYGKWQSDKDGHWQECTVEGCDAATLKAVHTFGEWKTVKDPTETEDGVKVRTCECGATETESISATGPVEIIVPDEVTTAYKLVVDDEGIKEVPEGLKKVEDCDTVEKIESKMLESLQVTEEESSENATIYDVELHFYSSEVGDWELATKDNFPESGIRVFLDYPEGTSRTTHDFVVSHMLTEEHDGHPAGYIEYPDYELTDDHIVVTLHSLSPVGVAWTEKPEEPVQPGSSGDGDVEAFIGAAVVIGGGAAALAYYYREALPVWKLAGVVTLAADTADAAAAPVANATVALLREGETVKTLTTDANGMFTARLPKGEYEAVVTWEKDGVAYAARGTVTAESVLKDGAVQEIVLKSGSNE